MISAHTDALRTPTHGTDHARGGEGPARSEHAALTLRIILQNAATYTRYVCPPLLPRSLPVTMPRTMDEDLAKGLTMAGRGMALKAAWEACGSPGSWGNVQRQHRARQPAVAAAAPDSAVQQPPSKRQRGSSSLAAEPTPAATRAAAGGTRATRPEGVGHERKRAASLR